MDANSNSPLIDRLKQELKTRNKSVVEFENETGIDKDKVYKWLKRGVSKIDHAEARKIESWLSGQMSSIQETRANEPAATYSAGRDDLEYSVKVLAESNAKKVDAILEKLTLLDYIKTNLDKVPDSMGLMTGMALKSYEEMTAKLLDELKDLKMGLSTYKPGRKSLKNQRH